MTRHRRPASTFSDRISELNHIYGYAVLATLFEDYERPIMDLRHVSRAQFKDQVRAGMRTGNSLRNGGWPM